MGWTWEKRGSVMVLHASNSVGKPLRRIAFLSVRSQGHLWASDWPWVRRPSGEQLSQHPAHGHAYNVAGPAEDPVVMAVATEVHDARTAKGALGSDAVADGVSDYDVTNPAGTAVVIATMPLKQTKRLAFAPRSKSTTHFYPCVLADLNMK